MGGRYGRLTRYCREQVGESLLSVFSYTEGAAELHYVHEDLKAEFRGGGLSRYQEAVWAIHTSVLQEAPKVEVFGNYRATVHAFERAFSVQFRVDDAFVVVALDREVGRNLHQFLLECERHIRRSTAAERDG
ncbi:MAG: hypothetical protein ABEJ23_08100 [Haloarculaceae archaeon]